MPDDRTDRPATSVASATATEGGPSAPERAGPAPRRLGRYHIDRRIGSGGLADVYLGHDPELDRRVAIKVIRADTARNERVRRLVREAKAIARLSHPNVVAIFDLGSYEAGAGPEGMPRGGVYVVMEYLRRGDLHAWMDRPHPWPEVVDVFLGAGRGLVAAHALGIVHRDFKPHNVLIADDGTAKVADFGIARMLGSATSDAGGSADGLADRDAAPVDPLVLVSDELTREGAVIGTPAYMAPEQHFDAAVTVAADQYSFCVSLYEALFGRTPFASTLPELLIDKSEGNLPRRPPGRGVPGWLYRAVVRGLAPEPADRHPSMKDLLARLDWRARRRRRMFFAAGAGAVALAAAIPWRATPSPCDARSLPPGYGDDERQALRAHVERAELRYAAELWPRLDARLGEFVSAWSAVDRRACEAAAADDAEANQHAQAAARCLEERWIHFEQLVVSLTAADARALGNAPGLLDSLRDPEECWQLDAAPGPILGSLDRERRLAIERILARGITSVGLGHVGDGLAAAQEARAEAAAAGRDDLLARAWLLQGRAELSQSMTVEAMGSYRHARVAAEAARSPELSVDALVGLVDAARQGRDFERAEELGELAAAKIEAHGVRGRAHALAIARGRVAMLQEKYDAADAFFAEAVGERPPSAMTRSELFAVGKLRYLQRRFAEAEDLWSLALDKVNAELGPGHPAAAELINNLAIAARQRGEDEHAAELLRGAIEIMSAAYGPESPRLSSIWSNLGGLQAQRGRPQAAQAAFGRAVAVERGRRAPAATSAIAVNLLRQAASMVEAGDLAMAQSRLQEGIAEAALVRTEQPELDAVIASVRARLAAATGDVASARSEAERCLRAETGGEREQRMECALVLVDICLATDDVARAVEAAELATTLAAELDAPPAARRRARLAVARARDATADAP